MANVDVTASLQANSMASAQCFAHSSKSEQCSYRVLFIRAICGVVWCGVVWCGVVWCGVVWCGVVWCGVVWCGQVREWVSEHMSQWKNTVCD